MYPGTTIRINANRPDIPVILSAALSRGSRSRAAIANLPIGCVPLSSPYLSADGKELLDSNKQESQEDSNRDEVDPELEVFAWGLRACLCDVDTYPALPCPALSCPALSHQMGLSRACRRLSKPFHQTTIRIIRPEPFRRNTPTVSQPAPKPCGHFPTHCFPQSGAPPFPPLLQLPARTPIFPHSNTNTPVTVVTRARLRFALPSHRLGGRPARQPHS